MQTKNIRLGPGGFLLPYHHPAELANRVAMLDHISGGRLNFGVAASGLPSDWAMFNVDGMSGVNRDMTREALEIILKLWSSTEPFDYKGKFWNVSQARRDVRRAAAAHQAAADPASADRRRRPQQGLRHAEARRREGLPADEPQPQPGLCRQPLGVGRDRRRQGRPHARPRRLAHGARGVRRRHRRGGDAALGRLLHGPHDARVLPAAARRSSASSSTSSTTRASPTST